MLRPHKENGYFYKKLCLCNTGFYHHEYVDDQCIYTGALATVPFADGECPVCGSFYYYDRRKPLKCLDWFVRLSKSEKLQLRENLKRFQSDIRSSIGRNDIKCTFSNKNGVISFFYDNIFFGRESLDKLISQRMF
jgi:hypothetical protein